MSSQKLEQLLQLSISLTDTEREKSQVLSAGYTPVKNTWDLIFKYHGNPFNCSYEVIDSSCRYNSWIISPLLAGYGIITLPADDIPVFAELPEIEYIEIPKELIISVEDTKRATIFL